MFASDSINKRLKLLKGSRITGLRSLSILHVVTSKPCYRKDDRAMRPIYGCPENFRGLPDYAHGYFSQNFMGFFVLMVPSERALVISYEASSVRLIQLQPVPVGVQDGPFNRDGAAGSPRRCLHGG